MHFSQSKPRNSVTKPGECQLRGKDIWQRILKASNILINIHRNPDLDSVGSALTLYYVLTKLKKKVTLIGPHPFDPSFSFLPNSEKIRFVDFATFPFTDYDLFLILDSSRQEIVTSSRTIALPETLYRIVIDHHKGNTLKGDIKFVDVSASASAEIIFKLLLDNNILIDKNIATMLLSAIIHDTVFFKYTENEKDTFNIVAQLMEFGADKNKIVTQIYNNLELPFIKNATLLLERLKKENNFVWTAVNFEEYTKMGRPMGLREYVADHFIQSIKNTDFGVVMIEEEKGKLCVSFRGKEGVDVSAIAIKLGGGGHLFRAGATIYEEYEKAVKKVLKTV